MDYNSILKEIKPTKEENKKISKLTEKIICFINNICEEENINAKAILVGSVAKETFLRGKSDIDIFISFPLDTPLDELKEKGLYLGYKCSDAMNGKASEHYASHPYVKSSINGFNVDFVPCYNINDSSQLKSAVDRTILHTNYIKNNLNEDQKDEVLLLKKFMTETKTYGSEFKVGGFAGYLCELLILYYGTFEKTLENAANWKFGTIIDLKNFKTANLFKDPLVTIDPTDKNRNVGSALRLDKMCQFISCSRNYLESKSKEKYFYPLKKDKIHKKDILENFDNRGTKTIAIKFNIPDIPLDTLHPQLNKTVESLSEKLNKEDFHVFKSGYWSDEEEIAILLLELNIFKQNNIKIHFGPKIFATKPCKDFLDKHGIDKCYTLNDFLVLNTKREFVFAEDLISHVFTKEYSHLIKIGKNLKKNILNTYELSNLEDLTFSDDFLNFLDDFLNPGQYLIR